MAIREERSDNKEKKMKSGNPEFNANSRNASGKRETKTRGSQRKRKEPGIQMTNVSEREHSRLLSRNSFSCIEMLQQQQPVTAILTESVSG